MSSKSPDDRRAQRGPRRLFSFDSSKTLHSRRTASEETSSDAAHTRGGSKFNALIELPEEREGEKPWASTDLVESPIGGGGGAEQNPFNDEPQPDSPKPALRKLGKKLSEAVGGGKSSPPPSPTSTVRWNSVRSHVLPPTTPPPVPSHSQQASSSSTLNLGASGRGNQTPKTSKFAQRLGFRQVVEQARETALDDARRFAYELQKVCWAVRSGEKSSAPIPTHGSSLSINQLAHVTNAKTRRQSLPPTSHTSLKPLYHVLLQHAQSGVQIMPCETLVLSTLLLPFLTFDKGKRGDEERWFGLESFEVIRKTWRPFDEPSAVDRALWCIQAAFIPPSALQLRILTSLWHLLVADAVQLTSHLSFCSISQGLFSLLPAVNLYGEDGKMVTQIIDHFTAGSTGELDAGTVEQEYNAIFIETDNVQAVREVLLVESLGHCVENIPEADAKWLLTNVVDTYWPVLRTSYSPLMSAMHCRKLAVFARVFVSLVESSPPDSNRRANDAAIVIKLLRERVLPELDIITSPSVTEAKSSFVAALLTVITADDMSTGSSWTVNTVSHWYRQRSEWQTTFETGLRSLIVGSPWPSLLHTLTVLIQIFPQEVCQPIVSYFLQPLHDRLADDEPPQPCIELTMLFNALSLKYPKIFYKPLFFCAAATKEISLINHLCSVNSLAKFLPDFWIRDADMISVAIAREVGGDTGETGPGALNWGEARAGQSVLVISLIGKIQSLRRDKESNSITETALVNAVKFVYQLEARLAAALQAREKKLLVPPSQRMLYCMLLREARLFTRSTKPAPWLRQIVTWFEDYHNHEYEDYFEDEVESAIDALKNIYAMLQNTRGHNPKTRKSTLLSVVVDTPRRSTLVIPSAPQENKLLVSLAKGYISRIMKLLVTVALMLGPEDLSRIGVNIWENHLDDRESSTIASACFLVMQAAEKAPIDLQATIEVNLGSLDQDSKLKGISRIGTLSNWRFQIMSQPVVADRQRRPFKLAKPPLPFIPTDMGNAHWVKRDDLENPKDNLPPEMRKRLAEIGWVDDDTPANQQLERIQTPFSLLPILELDRMENTNSGAYQASSPVLSPAPSPSASPNRGTSTLPNTPSELSLLRRNSSSGGPMYGVKRRSVFVPSLTRIFPMLASMVFDPDFSVAHVARATVIDLMRNDPSLLTRPVLDLLVDETKDIALAAASLRAFLHVRHTLPPSMAHLLFNHLTGFLKHEVKNTPTSEALRDMSYMLPILAKLVGQVSDLSVRDFRRAKVDICFVPSGSLYFPPGTINPAMFPQMLDSKNPFEDGLQRLSAVTMVRISQNMLMLDMLKKAPQDIQLVRKGLTRLVLPSWEEFGGTTPLELKAFIPKKTARSEIGPTVRSKDGQLKALSMLLSRSYLPLVAQIFRSMSRHLNDRSELAVLMDGINRILITHGDDIGIVSQALIALMVASTRFRRLFLSRGGYTLFMPSLLKVYTEAENHAGIRTAIEYALNRFFAHHREAFVYQSLDVVSHVMALPSANAPWIATSIYRLFSSLKTMSPGQDIAGIHESNKVQEREALLAITADEKPQTFLGLLRRGAKNNIIIDLPEETETKMLSVDNLVRLFLTVIAHDLTTSRSEQFLSFLRYLAPSFYEASQSARNVLHQGIEALSAVLLRVSPKAKTEGTKVQTESDIPQGIVMDEILDQQLNDKSNSPSDFVAMRLNYFALVNAFASAGGRLSASASRRNVDIMKTILKEGSKEVNDTVARLLAEYARATYLAEKDMSRNMKHLVDFLQELSPAINAYALTVDFSGVFDVIGELCQNSSCASEPAFVQLVMAQICPAGLEACALAASEKLLFALHCRPSLIRLLGQTVFLRDADVVAELEKHANSHEFMAGVVLPFALALKTTADLETDEGRRLEHWHMDSHRQTWVRLVAFVMAACQRRPPKRPVSDANVLERTRSKSSNNTADHDKERHVYTMVTALQILKIVVVRAEKEVASLPGIWLRVAEFLRRLLADGSASFALESHKDYSPTPSPTPSPRASGQFDFSSASMFMQSRRTYHNPRILDYCLWSLLELLCVYRSPLVLQLRLFTKEKVFTLDHYLRSVPSALSPGGSRPVSSVYAKPRRRSMAQTPPASPRGRPSGLWEPDPTYISLDTNGRSPISPGNAPHIVHLGPVAAPSLERSSSAVASYSVVSHAKTMKVKSLALMQATYRRIRLVQSCWGYQSMLLPLPGGEVEDDPQMRTWTVRKAVKEMLAETRQLLEEFDEEAYVEGDSTVVISADQSFGQY
ncbi:hypothetical protein CYLTODRAFT_366316 [Cylindrobasidium torrendii FP15055 ss-10]|uniref:Protein UNC80 C-terminal domain-containing protein n=1 Tax=Cylindrobasidium torrendii FP15055 ss-10 TaxID=1314674 RepID=A0A0D7BS62_9AGAR|nr:hypothetical protein CYLTODRAFT_366316 [Cylindrobasidium torrendii FP15055 ss-10]